MGELAGVGSLAVAVGVAVSVSLSVAVAVAVVVTKAATVTVDVGFIGFGATICREIQWSQFSDPTYKGAKICHCITNCYVKYLLLCENYLYTVSGTL